MDTKDQEGRKELVASRDRREIKVFEVHKALLENRVQRVIREWAESKGLLGIKALRERKAQLDHKESSESKDR